MIRPIIQKQRTFFRSQATRDLPFRLAQLEKLRQAIQKYEAAILEALHQDLGKPAVEAYLSEINLVLAEIKHVQKHLRHWMRPKKRATLLANLPAKSYVLAEPYGTVLIMGPWNYPFYLLFCPLIGAISGGNTAVVKPSELAPATAAAMTALLAEAFDPAYIAVVQGDASTAQELLAEPFDYIFFTGSPQVGRLVMQKAAQHLTPVTLELGGKSPVLVWHDCNLAASARRLVWGKFLNAGQTCVAPDYALVHEKIYDRFLQILQQTMREFYGPDPARSPDYGRIVNDHHMQRLQQYLTQGRIVCGGQTDPQTRFIAPTLLTDVPEESPLMTEEIFGPLLPIRKIRDYEEAVNFITARPKPLALYLFSGDRKLCGRFMRDVPAGGACINDTISHLVSHQLPFGGVGESGMGAYHGKASFDTFSHHKSVLERRTWPDIKIKYPPFRLNLTQIKRLVKYFF